MKTSSIGPSALHVTPIKSYSGIHIEVDGNSFLVINGDGRVIASIWEGARSEASTIACAIAQALEDTEVAA